MELYKEFSDTHSTDWTATTDVDYDVMDKINKFIKQNPKAHAHIIDVVDIACHECYYGKAVPSHYRLATVAYNK